MNELAHPAPQDLSCKPARETAWQDSAWLAWGIAAFAFGVAAFCLAILTWDGSFYFLQTLQDGTPMMPHGRWMNWLLLQPVLWARPLAGDPTHLAILHGLMCSILPLFSLGMCLLMLRGPFARLRYWAVLGILLVPLPGQILMIAEVTPALQLGWICLAFLWRGCPLRWAGVVVLVMVAMWGLHPVAAPSFFCAAATAVLLAFAGADRQTQRRFWIWATIFGLVFCGKMLEILLLASPYERANLQGSAWIAECRVGLLMTPFVALIPIALEAVRSLLADFRVARATAYPRLPRYLWIAAFVLGIAFSVQPGWWAGGLCFRKFGILFTIPIALLAGIEAWSHWRNPASAGLPTNGDRSILRPVLFFATVLICMSLSWKWLCGSLARHLAAHHGQVEMHDDLPWIERHSALNHWSITSLSLVLQGWKPKKVHVWSVEHQAADHHLCICPENECRWVNSTLDLSWLENLTVPDETER